MFKNFKKTASFLALALIFSLFSSYKLLDETEKQKLTMLVVLQNLLQYHYQSPAIDDSFSKKVYDAFIKEMDYSKRFFTLEDLNALKPYSDKLDDEIAAQRFEFFEKTNAKLESRINQVSNLYHEILAKPFDFNVDEKIEVDTDKRTFPANDDELKEYWRKYFKYQVLTNMVARLELQDKAKEAGDTSIKIKPLEQVEKEAREKVQKTHDEMFKRLLKTTTQERFNDYANCMVHVFDPHSDYFPPKEKENFDIQLSGKLEGIGATLQEKDGYIKVVSIVPGSPSAKQGELKPEDLILKVGQGQDEPVDIVDMRLDNAVKLIRGKKGTLVKLTVKKPNGSIKVIPIVRDVVMLEESYAKSVIIKDTKGKNLIGYINLPSFYVDFSNRNGRNCATDIKKELEKLKAEKVTGVIIDLRNNGGGSLQDVVTMGGFFIDKGPIVQVKTKEGDPVLLEDTDEGTIYDGPLVILVNQFSASASEILAAAMQDYKRAVIIGSTSSYGKGTVQRIFDLAQPAGTESYTVGSAKITTQKFYRINGGSTQLKGVTPDIVLPDLYMNLKLGEKEMENALQWDQIQLAPFKPWKENSLDLKTIVSNSQTRTSKDELFKQITAHAEYFKQKQDNTVHYLHLQNFRKELNDLKKEEEKYKDEDKEIHHWQIHNLKADEGFYKDSTKQERNKAFIHALKKDAYLFEAVQVIKEIK